jgi:hypothetical protein
LQHLMWFSNSTSVLTMIPKGCWVSYLEREVRTFTPESQGPWCLDLREQSEQLSDPPGCAIWG